MENGRFVKYVDAFGKEHDALVVAQNGLNEGFVTLVYVDPKLPESDNLKKIFDVPHASHESKDEYRVRLASDQGTHPGATVEEGNKDLPRYVANVWKEVDEEHKAFPEDHPQFDHPYKQKELDENAQIVLPSRPQYEAEVAAHQAEQGQPTDADLDAVVNEQQIAEATSGEPQGAADPPVN